MQPGIQLDDADVPGESAEPFDFDHLTGWTVRTQLMRTWAESGELAYADLQTYLRRDGLLAERSGRETTNESFNRRNQGICRVYTGENR